MANRQIITPVLRLNDADECIILFAQGALLVRGGGREVAPGQLLARFVQLIDVRGSLLLDFRSFQAESPQIWSEQTLIGSKSRCLCVIRLLFTLTSRGRVA